MGETTKDNKTVLLSVETESEADEWSIENVNRPFFSSRKPLNATTATAAANHRNPYISNNTANDSRQRNAGCVGIVRSWYTPVYDFSDPNLTDQQRLKRRRYCYGRLSPPAFVCVHIMFFLFLFWAIFLPILLLVIIPNIVQSTFEGIGGDMLNVQR